VRTCAGCWQKETLSTCAVCGLHFCSSCHRSLNCESIAARATHELAAKTLRGRPEGVPLKEAREARLSICFAAGEALPDAGPSDTLPPDCGTATWEGLHDESVWP
jgi:hypothetical protein